MLFNCCTIALLFNPKIKAEIQSNTYWLPPTAQNLKIMKNYIFYFLISFIFVIALLRAVDLKMENQEKMLCNSAKISGNIEFQNKCKCYYNGNAISCIYNK